MLKSLIPTKLTTYTMQRLYSSTCQEVQIPVPWGHIAGKWWGPQDKRPIMATHGWQDNSGTFDTLIPLLPENLSLLAVDFPGCGYSSRLPPGVFYHPIDTVILLRRLVKYFNWTKVSLLGHSLGAVINYMYTLFYPDEVDFLVSLDALTPPVLEGKAVERMKSIIDAFLKYDDLNNLKKEPPSYSFQEMEQKLHESLHSIALDKCKYILQRNIKPSSVAPNKFCFTVDPRWKAYDLLRWSEKDVADSVSRINCPILLTKVETSPFFRTKFSNEILNIIKRHNKNLEVHDIEGAHHVHLNNPERVEGVINQFLRQYDVSDRCSSGKKKFHQN